MFYPDKFKIKFKFLVPLSIIMYQHTVSRLSVRLEIEGSLVRDSLEARCRIPDT